MYAINALKKYFQQFKENPKNELSDYVWNQMMKLWILILFWANFRCSKVSIQITIRLKMHAPLILLALMIYYSNRWCSTDDTTRINPKYFMFNYYACVHVVNEFLTVNSTVLTVKTLYKLLLKNIFKWMDLISII